MTGRELVELAGRLQGLDAGTRPDAGRGDARRRSASPTPRGAGSAGTRAGCASASGSPRRSSPSPACWSSTSRSARSIRRAGATCSRSSPTCASGPRSSSRPTSSPTSSGSATASGSSTTAGWSPRGRSTTLLARYALPLYRLDPEPGQADGGRPARRPPARRPLGRPGRADERGLVVSVTDADVASSRAAADRRRGGRPPGRLRARRGRRSRTSSSASSGGPPDARPGGPRPQGAARVVADATGSRSSAACSCSSG